jgi:serine-type D-Ala-D-Ala carboxypeptidase (penicillin-binding protein 5/6)
MKKNILLSILVIFMLVFGFHYSAKANVKPLSLKCMAGVVIDQDSGRILYSKNGDKVLPMASTTKIMTAIIAIEKGKLNDKVIVSHKAASINGSSANLKSGESITLEELIYGLMLRSGNDAAIAIAEHIGGSVENFVELMNDKAIELGLYNTSFETPHGLDNSEHFTTAEELAKITAYAMKNNELSKVVATKTINEGKFGKFNRSYSNINKFLFKLSNADGVKTGYTGNAGKCLVASTKSGNGRYIAVILNSNDRWRDAEKLVKYAEENFHYIKICNKGTIGNKIKVNSKPKENKYVKGQINKDFYLPVLKNKSEQLEIQYYLPSVILMSPSPSTLTSPSEIIGNVAVSINNKIVSIYPVYYSNKSKTNE